jgi:hypothetical protein
MYGIPAASSNAANRWMTASGVSAEVIELSHELFESLPLVGLGLPRPDPGQGELSCRLAHPAGGGETPLTTEAPLGFGLGA